MRLRLLLGLAALILAGAVGCASAPAAVRLTSDDCLVLIPTRLVNPDNAPTARKFAFRFSGKLRPAEVSQRSTDYIPVLVQDGTVKIIGLTSDVQGDNVRGEDWSVSLFAELPYEPAAVIVWDKTFVHSLKRQDSRTFTSDFGFEKTSDEVRSSVTAAFAVSALAAEWKD